MERYLKWFVWCDDATPWRRPLPTHSNWHINKAAYLNKNHRNTFRVKLFATRHWKKTHPHGGNTSEFCCSNNLHLDDFGFFGCFWNLRRFITFDACVHTLIFLKSTYVQNANNWMLQYSQLSNGWFLPSNRSERTTGNNKNTMDDHHGFPCSTVPSTDVLDEFTEATGQHQCFHWGEDAE